MNFDAALGAIDGHRRSRLRPRASGHRSGPTSRSQEYRRRYARLAALMDAAGLRGAGPHPGGAGPVSVRLQLGHLGGRPVAADGPRGGPRSAQAVLIALGVRRAAARPGTSWARPGRHLPTMPESCPAKVAGHLAGDRRRGRAAGRLRVRARAASWPLPQQLVSRDHRRRSGGRRPGTPAALISALRMLKSPLEIERIRRSVGAAVAGYRAGAGGGQGRDDGEGTRRDHRLDHVPQRRHGRHQAAVRQLRLRPDALPAGRLAGLRQRDRRRRHRVRRRRRRQRRLRVRHPAADRVGTLRAEDRRYAEVAAERHPGRWSTQSVPACACPSCSRRPRPARGRRRASPSRSARSPGTASAWSSGSAR